MLITNLITTPLQLFLQLIIISEVIFKSLAGPDDTCQLDLQARRIDLWRLGGVCLTVRRLRMRKSNDWEGENKNSRQFVLIMMMTLMQPRQHSFVMATLELISQDIEA